MSPLADNLIDADRDRPTAAKDGPRQCAGGPESAAWGMDRRQFARLMAASMALAGATLSGCRRWPPQQLRPQSERSEGFLPGVAEYFATQFEHAGVATGILAKSLDGRPIKIEGNELHPFSLGAAGILAQASLWDLYDPSRSRSYVYRPANGPQPASLNSDQGQVLEYTRQEFEQAVATKFAELRNRKGVGLYFLCQPNSSPTLARLRTELRVALPEASWHVYQPIDRDNELAESEAAFGQQVRCQYHLDRARMVVCVQADILGSHPAHQRWCRDWAHLRQPDRGDFSRLVAIESAFSLTGAAADVRHAIRPSQLSAVVQYFAHRLGLVDAPPILDADIPAWANSLLQELQLAGGKGLLVGGPSLPGHVHAWIHAINHRLGSFGSTVSLTEEPLAESKSSVDSLAQLAGALRGGAVDTLVIWDGNPIYDAPPDLQLQLSSSRPGQQNVSLYLGLSDNETARQCSWHVPAAHYLECWGDGRAWDGTYGVQQPLIRPLYDGMSAIELLALIAGRPVTDGHDLVRETARTQWVINDESKWQTLLHDGLLPDSQYPTLKVRPATIPPPPPPPPPPPAPPAPPAPTSSEFELQFTADSKVFDGRYADNGWLQELPDPLTKMTWGNAAWISQADAVRHNLSNGDHISVQLTSDLELSSIPVLIQPGHAVGCLTLPLGYGRRVGFIATDVGSDVNALRTSRHRDAVAGATITKTGRWQQLAITEEDYLTDEVGARGRDYRVGRPAEPGALVRETTLDQHRLDPEAVHRPFHEPQPAPMFDPPHSFRQPHAWGMAIDLNRCIGCSACVIACQAENNIPVVGPANVLQNREMHWIRIDRYFKGGPDSPSVVHVPVACVQCEDAPCEQVCPVAATVHDSEGLNAMVYNRCVGTRYCANNCPYKVRRFNYFDYHAADPKTPPRPWLDLPDRQTATETSRFNQLIFNPAVSVRMRGVMEKCTYCVQRISLARHNSKLEQARGRRPTAILNDGEVVTACQQACPTQAISFGNLNDPNSQVAKAHHDSRAYAMLGELNVKPRTKYLARIRQPALPVSDSTTEPVSHERD